MNQKERNRSRRQIKRVNAHRTCRQPSSRRRNQPPIPTRRSANQMLVDTNTRFSQSVVEAINEWPLSERQRRRVEVMLGLVPGRTRLAVDASLRIQVGNAFGRELRRLCRHDPALALRHITCFDDRARFRDREGRIDLEPFKKRLRALFRDHGVHDYIGVLEFEGHTNSEKGEGRWIAPHFHVIYASPRRLKVKALEAALAGSKRLRSVNEASTVKITTIRRTSGDRAYVAAYLWKGPERGKNVMQRRDGRAATVTREAKLPPTLAIRLAEVLSHFEMEDLVISSGRLVPLRKQLIELMRASVADEPAISKETVAKIWRRARRHARKTSYRPIEIVKAHRRR